MANPIVRVLISYRSNIGFPRAFGLLCLTAALLIQTSIATEFAIGGSKGWSIPTDPSATSYNQWAEIQRFQIGDSIMFNYSPDQDSVLKVSQEDYTNCNTNASTAEKFTDGHTVYEFKQSGPHYFISGNKDNCLKNEKVVVIVLADRSGNATAPSSSNSTDITPSPAPSGEQSPPSPPPGMVESSPTPAPESLPPPPSGAASIFLSFVGSIGAFAASSTLLLL